METITYRKLRGYKYQLIEPFEAHCPTILGKNVSIPGMVYLNTMGSLLISAGYCWDGPSGPTIDTPSFMRGSLVHDAFYQLMRAEELDPTVYRILTDRQLRYMCLEDGMNRFRAWYVYRGVRMVGGRHAKPTGPFVKLNRYTAP